MKKIGPVMILKQCGPNAYKIDLSSNISLSPIFNVSDIYTYKSIRTDDCVAGQGEF